MWRTNRCEALQRQSSQSRSTQIIAHRLLLAVRREAERMAKSSFASPMIASVHSPGKMPDVAHNRSKCAQLFTGGANYKAFHLVVLATLESLVRFCGL